jgi:hypothetical protein
MQKIIGKIRKLEVREIFKIEIVGALIETSYDTAPFLVSFFGNFEYYADFRLFWPPFSAMS